MGFGYFKSIFSFYYYHFIYFISFFYDIHCSESQQSENFISPPPYTETQVWCHCYPVIHTCSVLCDGYQFLWFMLVIKMLLSLPYLQLGGYYNFQKNWFSSSPSSPHPHQTGSAGKTLQGNNSWCIQDLLQLVCFLTTVNILLIAKSTKSIHSPKIEQIWLLLLIILLQKVTMLYRIWYLSWAPHTCEYGTWPFFIVGTRHKTVVHTCLAVQKMLWAPSAFP